MIKMNVWEIINKEAATIIKAIENGEVKTRGEFVDYLETAYSWKTAGAATTIVDLYMSVNNIDMPWDYETEESAE